VTISIDFERRRIRAGVRDVLGEPAQRSIGLTGTGLSRLWIGAELHRRIQRDMEAAEPGFRSEVPTEIEIEIDGWTVEIAGRADGVIFDDGRAVRVDEIKTLHFAVDLHNLYAQERLDRFRRQAALYALMVSEAAHPAAARLILVDIVSHEEQYEEVVWDREAVLAWLRQQIHRRVAHERRRLTRLENLREAAASLPFPYPEPRPVQDEIGAMVAETLAEDRHLLVRAPTGCGKTAAVLYPAVQAALGRGQRVFFLTAKTLQQRIAVETANAMQDGVFRSLQLRAKSKMCANTEIVCHEEFCPYARDYGHKLVQTRLLENLLDSHEHQDPDRIFAAAKEHTVCPFEVSLDLLPDVNLVVCDYNYVFDPTIGLHALLHGDALRDAVLIIDEAHNLVDRSREYYSPEIGTAILERARRFLETRSNPVFEELAGLVADLEREIRERVADSLDDEGPDEGPADLDHDAISDLRIAFDGAVLSYFLYKREHEMWMADDPGRRPGSRRLLRAHPVSPGPCPRRRRVRPHRVPKRGRRPKAQDLLSRRLALRRRGVGRQRISHRHVRHPRAVRLLPRSSRLRRPSHRRALRAVAVPGGEPSGARHRRRRYQLSPASRKLRSHCELDRASCPPEGQRADPLPQLRLSRSGPRPPSPGASLGHRPTSRGFGCRAARGPRPPRQRETPCADGGARRHLRRGTSSASSSRATSRSSTSTASPTPIWCPV